MNAKKSPAVPAYRHHKGTGQGCVVLNGQWRYLGPYERPATRQKYDQVIAEWLANGRTLPVDPDDITVTELAAMYWKHAKDYYRHPDGTPTTSLVTVKSILSAMTRLYGLTLATDFGPLALRASVMCGYSAGLPGRLSITTLPRRSEYSSGRHLSKCFPLRSIKPF